MDQGPVRRTAPRQTVQAKWPDGRTYEAPVGTSLAAFVEAAHPEPKAPIVAAFVDGKVRELDYKMERDVCVTPIDTSTNVGMRIYQRSVSFVLVVAMRELFPEAHVIIDHSVTLGGFFCQVEGRGPLDENELQTLEKKMREIVEADEPIGQESVSTQDAIKLFASQGYDDKVHLLTSLDRENIPVYTLRGVRDYFYGRMAHNTGSLAYFSLEHHPPGFILRLPNRRNPTVLPPSRDYPKLMAVFREYGHWINILGVQDIGLLNRALDERMLELMLVAEALHEKNISDIADAIVERRDTVRLVLIAGPSSSGKTTFARRLAVQLMVGELHPFALALDDYFVDREDTPRDENGEYDYEALEAINLELFNAQLQDLMAGKSVRLPHYNFAQGKSEWGEEIHLPEGSIIIVEGIHGLNPRLVTRVAPEAVYRIYVSALTQLNIDHHNRVPTTDTRLLRRIVRDARYRGYSAQGTIERWESVRRGEERNIFPYQENADVMFNSALVYELSVLKPFAEPLLLRVPEDSLEGLEAARLLSFLQWVKPSDPQLVPDNSLLREFIGDSIFRDFRI
ncbi:MAG: nucleoside kinase [Chloroflexota bacterium]|nr:nucleoside kinase [Chloroflexota bacterium]